jgi:hypothetical protein
VVFCKQLEFQDEAMEAGCGENIVLDTREIAVLKPESNLIRLEVQPR